MTIVYATDLPFGRGKFEIRNLALESDLALVWKWWTSDHVVGRWSTESRLGPPKEHGYAIEDLAQYLARLTRSDSHVQPVIGMIDGTPMTYMEVYDVAFSPLANHPDLGADDRGLHLMIGEPAFVGQGLTALLAAPLLAWQFTAHPRAQRLVCEPDSRNSRAIRAIQGAAKHAAVVEEKGNVQLKHKVATVLFVERSAFAAFPVAT